MNNIHYFKLSLSFSKNTLRGFSFQMLHVELNLTKAYKANQAARNYNYSAR